jgi:hypothetical protein
MAGGRVRVDDHQGGRDGFIYEVSEGRGAEAVRGVEEASMKVDFSF